MMHKYASIYFFTFSLFISCKEIPSDNTNKSLFSVHKDSLSTNKKHIIEDLPLSALISKLKTAGLPQTISAEDKLADCLLSKEEISTIFMYLWPEDTDPQSTHFLNVQKYSETERYTFIGVEFEIKDGGSYHAVNFCTYDNKSGKIISEIEGLIFSEGGTDYSDGSIEIRKNESGISLEMSSTENDSEDVEKTIYILRPEGIFDQM